MRTERHSNPPPLWNWIPGRLPQSLVFKKIKQGYGWSACIYRAGYRRGIIDTLFENLGDAVAFVHSNEIELYHPEYYSDFEDLLRKYESETGAETTLKFWESVVKASQVWATRCD